MPSKSQLHLIWEAQSEFFGGAGQPKENLEGSAESGGFTTNHTKDTPLIPRKSRKRKSVESLGTLEYDPERKDYKLVLNKHTRG